MKKIKKVKPWHFYLIFLSVVLLLIFARISALDDSQMSAEAKTTSNDKGPINPLKSSGYWSLTSNITINDTATGVGAHNWTWAKAQDWCSGSGIYSDPFLIENVSVTISSGSYGIAIYDSNTTTYFRINNVTIVNSDASGSGILLNNTYNGEILSSTCNDMGSGIRVETASNLTIDSNTMNNNSYGLYLDNVTTTTISGNSILNNTNTGIYGVNCTYNTIGTLNDLTDNNLYGIYLEDSDENELNQNYIRSTNETGIQLVDCDNCTVYYNTIALNNIIGLAITEDDGDSTLNLIYRNDFDDNGVNAHDNCSVANSWDNGSMGNDWDNYYHYDGDDDGIGDVAWDVPGTAGATDRYPIYDDGVEPTVRLSNDDDADELFEDEKNRELEIDWYLVAGVTAITIGIIAGGFILIKKKKILPKRKTSYKKHAKKKYGKK